MSDRTERVEQAFAALDAGDLEGLGDFFAEDAQWVGIPGSGQDGHTPI